MHVNFVPSVLPLLMNNENEPLTGFYIGNLLFYVDFLKNTLPIHYIRSSTPGTPFMLLAKILKPSVVLCCVHSAEKHIVL